MANAKRSHAQAYPSGLPKGRRLKSSGKDQTGGLCTLPPPVRTTDDLIRVLHELKDLIQVVHELSGPDHQATAATIHSLTYDAERWCELVADALEQGTWPELHLDHDSADLWSTAAAKLLDLASNDYHGSLLSRCVRYERAARSPLADPPTNKRRAA